MYDVIVSSGLSIGGMVWNRRYATVGWHGEAVCIFTGFGNAANIWNKAGCVYFEGVGYDQAIRDLTMHQGMGDGVK